MEPGFLKLIKNDKTYLEREPLEAITKKRKLAAFKHQDFWQCVDTIRDKKKLEILIKNKNIEKFLTKKILIVGGSGFLGFNLAKKLDSSKFKIFLLCKNKKSRPSKLKKAKKYLYCDLQNISKLNKVLSTNFDIIVNFSGNIDHQNKSETYKTHYQGVKNLVSLVRNKGVKLLFKLVAV